MDDVFNSGREQEDDMYEIIADANIGANYDDADIDDDGSRYLNDSGEGMFEEGEEQNLQLTTKSAEVYIYITPLVIIKCTNNLFITNN